MAIIIALLLTTLCGCSAPNNSAVDVSGGDTQQSELVLTPQTRPDQGPFRIAVIDIDPYQPASVLFYNLLQRLREEGWIQTDHLPFDQTLDVKAMVEELSKEDIGPYLYFVPEACYYLAYQAEEDIICSLQAQAVSEKGIDLIIAMGTDPGLLAKKMNMNLPVVVTMATDPVAAGIVKSENDSGDPNVWALIERDPMQRQLRYYHKIYPFKHLGMVVPQGEELVAGAPRYRQAAADLGVQLSEISLDRKQYSAEEYRKVLTGAYQDLAEKGIDAYLLLASVIDNSKDCPDVFREFNRRQIPVLVSDGDDYVQNGGLLVISSYDYAGYGMFCADIISSILNGKKAGDLSCLYASPPYISFNLDVAKEIHFQYDFDFLLACENIYTESEKAASRGEENGTQE